MPDAVTMLSQADGVDGLKDDFESLRTYAQEHGVDEPTIPLERAIEMANTRSQCLRLAASDQVVVT